MYQTSFDVVWLFFIPLCAAMEGAMEGQPISTALLPAGHSCNSHSYGQSTVHMQFLFSAQIIMLTRQKQQTRAVSGRRQQSQGRRWSSQEGEKQQEVQGHPEGKAPPRAPLLLFPPTHLLARWHSASLLTSCDRVAACPTTSPCSLVLSERKTGKWRNWVNLKQEWQQSTFGLGKHGKPLQTPSRDRELGQAGWGATLRTSILKHPSSAGHLSLPASPQDPLPCHLTLVALQQGISWAPPTVFTHQ